MLARLERRLRVAVVRRVRTIHDHQIDLGRGDQLIDIREAARSALVLGRFRTHTRMSGPKRSRATDCSAVARRSSTPRSSNLSSCWRNGLWKTCGSISIDERTSGAAYSVHSASASDFPRSTHLGREAAADDCRSYGRHLRVCCEAYELKRRCRRKVASASRLDARRPPQGTAAPLRYSPRSL